MDLYPAPKSHSH